MLWPGLKHQIAWFIHAKHTMRQNSWNAFLGFLDVPRLRMSHLEAELGKLAHNAYIATKVTFTVEIERLENIRGRSDTDYGNRLARPTCAQSCPSDTEQGWIRWEMCAERHSSTRP